MSKNTFETKNVENLNQCAKCASGKIDKLPPLTTNVDHGEEVHVFSPPDSTFSYEACMVTAKFLMERVPFRPKVGIICGSGLGPVAEALENPIKFPYEVIPNFPVSTVHGHAGELIFGHLSGVPVICMKGRFHCYEGYPLWKCSMPVRVMKLCGITHLIPTNAAGGLNPDFNIGDIMVLSDHLNIMGLAGNSALMGPNDERFGPRFPAMTRAYDKDLRMAARKIAERLGMTNILREGVYINAGGPSYETIAELRMLKACGVDAVGMSTVHEVITAKHCDLIVFSFSLITNKCLLDYDSNLEPCHEEVIDTGKNREEQLKAFVTEMVKHIGQTG